jgi:phytoene synthase
VVSGQARNFSYGIRLLPAPKRRALSAVYAFARRVDDIGDGDLPADRKKELLAEARLQAAAPVKYPKDQVLAALADAAARYPLDLGAFGELIDGCEQDQLDTVYQTWDEVAGYCRNVAGSIGRLSLAVFDPPALRSDPELPNALADRLGLALQLTNILRDIREDYQNGRVYLPSEDLAKFDVALDAPSESQFSRLVEFEAERARDWYATGLGLLPMLDWRSAACTGAMAGIYRRLLERIAAQPAEVLRGRMSLSTGQKAAVAVKALAGRIG